MEDFICQDQNILSLHSCKCCHSKTYVALEYFNNKIYCYHRDSWFNNNILEPRLNLWASCGGLIVEITSFKCSSLDCSWERRTWVTLRPWWPLSLCLSSLSPWYHSLNKSDPEEKYLVKTTFIQDYWNWPLWLQSCDKLPGNYQHSYDTLLPSTLAETKIFNCHYSEKYLQHCNTEKYL